MDSSRDREAFLRRRRERYWLQRERETVEEREVRLTRRREYYRRRRATISTEQREAILQQRRAAPTNTPWTVADEDATSCETSIPSASWVIFTHTETTISVMLHTQLQQLPRDTFKFYLKRRDKFLRDATTQASPSMLKHLSSLYCFFVLMACQPRVCMCMHNTKYCIVEVSSKRAFINLVLD